MVSLSVRTSSGADGSYVVAMGNASLVVDSNVVGVVPVALSVVDGVFVVVVEETLPLRIAALL